MQTATKQLAGGHGAIIRVRHPQPSPLAGEDLLRQSQEYGGVQPYHWDFASNTVRCPTGLADLFELPDGRSFTRETLLSRVHPDDRSRLEAAFHEAVRSGEPYDQKVRLVLPDGGVRWILARGKIVCDDKGQPRAAAGIILDVTYSKLDEVMLARREAELASSERRVRVLSDAMPQMVWTTRPDGYHDYFNQRWYDFTGVPEGSTYGEEWSHLFHPEDQDRLWSTWRHSLATGAPYEIEYRLRHRSGEYRWVLGRALPLRNEQGEIERWFGTCTDIHDLKKTQQALGESKEFSTRLLASLDDCIAVLDLDGRLLFMSEGGQRVLELKDFREIEGARWLTIWASTAPEEVNAALESAKAGGTTRFRSFCPTLGGTPKWWDVHATSIKAPDGSAERLLWVARDITQRKLAEDRAVETAERYALAAKAAREAIWDWNIATGHVLSNDVMQDLSGHPPEEVVASGTWWEEHVHPEDRERVINGVHAVINGPHSHWSAEYRFRRADGSYAVVSDNGHVLRDESGRAVRMIGAMLDISARKQLEEQQTLINHELNHRVKNTLATVQAVISTTGRTAKTVSEFQEAVTERILALAKTHTLLIQKNGGGASLHDILQSELEPYSDAAGRRVRLDGPDVRLSADMAVTLGMAAHELTTNAAKYGALSLATGRVDVAWGLAGEADGARKLTLEWREQGGPPVKEPQRQGFGSVLLKKALGRQLGSEVVMTFAPGGLEVRIDAMLPTAKGPGRE